MTNHQTVFLLESYQKLKKKKFTQFWTRSNFFEKVGQTNTSIYGIWYVDGSITHPLYLYVL